LLLQKKRLHVSKGNFSFEAQKKVINGALATPGYIPKKKAELSPRRKEQYIRGPNRKSNQSGKSYGRGLPGCERRTGQGSRDNRSRTNREKRKMVLRHLSLGGRGSFVPNYVANQQGPSRQLEKRTQKTSVINDSRIKDSFNVTGE